MLIRACRLARSNLTYIIIIIIIIIVIIIIIIIIILIIIINFIDNKHFDKRHQAEDLCNSLALKVN